MKTELSISSDYCPKWGLWEGVREVVQNFLDSRDDGNDGAVRHIPASGTLIVFNKGATLSRAQLGLLGETTKAGTKARGEFGEGLKIGLLALVRSGYRVIIRSGDRAYTAGIERSKRFGDKYVLVFRDRKIEHIDGVEIRISSIPEPQWDEIRERFLDLRNRPVSKVHNVPYHGAVLMDEADKGRVYVKGIWVHDNPDLHYGYNFQNVEVDRDRKMVSSWNTGYHASAILVNACTSGLIDPDTFLTLLQRGAPDLSSVASHMSRELFDQIEAAFHSKFGENAVAVASPSEAAELEHFGLHGVTVPAALTDLFVRNGKGTSDRVKSQKCVVEFIVPWDQIEAESQVNILAVYDLLRQAQIPFDSNIISYVKFMDPTLLGLHKQEDGRVDIHIAVPVASDRTNLLSTLVEELAHYEGPDGSMAHKCALHNIYGKLLKYKLDW